MRPNPSALCGGLGRTAGLRKLGDAGSETVEIVLVLPALMALVVLGLQLALWGIAAHALTLGVAEGGAVARSQSGTDRGAEAIVAGDVHSIAGSLVGSLRVDVHSLGDRFVSVTATGDVPSIFPGMHLHVSAESVGPVEGFRASA